VKFIRTVRMLVYMGISSVYIFVAILTGYADKTQNGHFWLDETIFFVFYLFLLFIAYILYNVIPEWIWKQIQKHRANRQKEYDLQNEQDLWDTIR
jgi:hypothetical protein